MSTGILLSLLLLLTNVNENEGYDCPIWHIQDQNSGKCVCISDLQGSVSCDETFVYVDRGYCMTWNNSTKSAEIHQCLVTHWDFNGTCVNNSYSIPVHIVGSELNYRTCETFNREGTYCRECIDGYGPAAYTNSLYCADCSKHRHLWILVLLFQLTMVTLTCLVCVLFQLKGTASPLNIIIAYIHADSFF